MSEHAVVLVPDDGPVLVEAYVQEQVGDLFKMYLKWKGSRIR